MLSPATAGPLAPALDVRAVATALGDHIQHGALAFPPRASEADHEARPLGASHSAIDRRNKSLAFEQVLVGTLSWAIPDQRLGCRMLVLGGAIELIFCLALRHVCCERNGPVKRKERASLTTRPLSRGESSL